MSQLILEGVGFLTDRGALLGTRVRLSFPRGPPPVSGARVQLRQAFLNLILSAVEAMRGTPARQRRLWIAAALESEPPMIHVVIRHTGKQTRKLDSLQFAGALARTHSDPTALRLAVTQAVVAEHGGRIWIKRSRPGAELHVALPVAPDKPA